jgi:hypothetical protein
MNVYVWSGVIFGCSYDVNNYFIPNVIGRQACRFIGEIRVTLAAIGAPGHGANSGTGQESKCPLSITQVFTQQAGLAALLSSCFRVVISFGSVSVSSVLPGHAGYYFG